MRSTHALSLAALLAALALAAPADAQGRRLEGRTPAPADAHVEVSAPGTIRISGWNRTEVQVTGSAASAGDRLVLEASGRSVEVGIRAERGRPGLANLDIRVPAGSSVEVRARGGAVAISGVTGAVEVSSQGGAVAVAGRPRSVEIGAAGGTVTVEGVTETLEIASMGGTVRVTADVRRRVEVTTVGGPVLLGGAVADVEVTSMGGGIRIDNASGRVEVSAVSGDVQVRGSRLRGSVQNVSGAVVVTATGPLGGALSIDSHGGGVELRLPPRVGATVNVTSFRGGFVSELDAPIRREGGNERQVVVAGGGPTVDISTFSGDVKLSRP